MATLEPDDDALTSRADSPQAILSSQFFASIQLIKEWEDLAVLLLTEHGESCFTRKEYLQGQEMSRRNPLWAWKVLSLHLEGKVVLPDDMVRATWEKFIDAAKKQDPLKEFYAKIAIYIFCLLRACSMGLRMPPP